MKAPDEKPALKPGKKTILFILAVGLLAAGGYFAVQWFLFRLNFVSTDDARVKGNLISLSAKVSARVEGMRVEEGDPVKAGQILVELDPRDYLAARAQALAGLEMARQDLAKAGPQLALTKNRVLQGIDTAEASCREALEGLKFSEKDAALQAERVQKDIDRAKAGLQAARARSVEVRATMENAQKEFERQEELFKNKYIAENTRDAAETARQVAESRYRAALENEREALAQLESAEANRRSVDLKKQNVRISEQILKKAKINLALAREERKQISIQEKNLEFLKAKVRESEAALELAEIRLRETRVVSPISGVVSKRFADQGQYVQPGQPLLTVNDPSEKWVVANVEETKVRKVRRGAAVQVAVDAFPGRHFEGQVEFVGSAAVSEFALLPAENPSGNFVKITHRLPVRISVKDPDHLLKPGMMVVVAIEAK